MKYGKILSIAGLGAISLILVSCNKESYSAKIVDRYVSTSTDKSSQKLYFSAMQEGIPYIDVDDIPEFMTNLLDGKTNKSVFTVVKDKESCRVEREETNGSYIEFDFKNNSFYSNNVNYFPKLSYKKYTLDPTSLDASWYDDNGNVMKDQTKLFEMYGSAEVLPNATVVDFDDYDIKIVHEGDKYLVPFQTFYDLCGPHEAACAFNGNALFVTGSTLDTSTVNSDGKTMADLYYENSDASRSKAMIEYNYNELCLNMDTSYGLKETHGITAGFDAYFTAAGIKKLFLSENKQDTDKAYTMVGYSVIADQHTAYRYQMPYEGYIAGEETAHILEIPLDISVSIAQEKSMKTTTARTANGLLDKTGVVYPYYENGDTAFITFDSFMMRTDGDFYYSDEFINDMESYIGSDTVALACYAQKRIMENENITRVVIDISGNGGGMVDSAIFFLGWLNSGVINLQDPVNGGHLTMYFKSDTNLDKKIDENDSLPSRVNNVYCVISQTSFSCGNIVPCMLKEMGIVKLVGTQSGGGACSVKVSSTADGSILMFSSDFRFCTTRNGSYYSVDEGATPDIFISDTSILYGGSVIDGLPTGDRANLISYLKRFEG